MMVDEELIVEKYYNENNELAILVSWGYGAGWSTWNCKEIAYDKRIIEFFIKEKPCEFEMIEFLESIGYHDVYMGGYENLEIRWIPKGTLFCIDEHDGWETLETEETLCIMIA